MTKLQVNRSTAVPLASGRDPAQPPGEAGPHCAPEPALAESSGDDAGAASLAVYLRDIARGGLLSRAQEGALAARMGQLRGSLWRAALGYPSFVVAIGELARELLPAPGCPTDALDALALAARKLRDRDLLIHREQYRSAREAVALALAGADRDGLVIDRLLADLTALEAGEHRGLSMRIKQPPRGSLPFINYVHSVRREYQALWATRNEFVQANLRLVVAVARRYSRHMPLQDLIQEGNLGLMKAVDRFDAGKGCRFSTYGIWWIRHTMTRAIAETGRTVRVPVHMLDVHNRALRARQQFEGRHGRPASEDELAAICGVSPERLAQVCCALAGSPLSLDLRRSDDTELTLLDTLEDIDAPPAPEAIDQRRRLAVLEELFARLAPAEADILRKRTGMDGGPALTLQEIGRGRGLSRERIRQLQDQALARLRTEFERRRLR